MSQSARQGEVGTQRNRTLMILRVVYVLLIIGGGVGIVLGAMQGAWLIVVTAVFWVSQECRYGISAGRGR